MYVCILYISLPSNKVVLDKYVHSNIVLYVCMYVCILYISLPSNKVVLDKYVHSNIVLYVCMYVCMYVFYTSLYHQTKLC